MGVVKDFFMLLAASSEYRALEQAVARNDPEAISQNRGVLASKVEALRAEVRERVERSAAPHDSVSEIFSPNADHYLPYVFKRLVLTEQRGTLDAAVQRQAHRYTPLYMKMQRDFITSCPSF
jgi:hypothetical protein